MLILDKKEKGKGLNNSTVPDDDPPTPGSSNLLRCFPAKKTQPYNQAVLEVDICALKIIIDICDRLSMILTGSELIITLNTISVSDGE